MEENINNDNADNLGADQNLDTTASSENLEGKQDVVADAVQPTNAEIAASYLKEQGFEFETFEDLKKVPERVEVNPYESLLDEDDKAYFNYKKETGRGRKDYEKLNANIDEIPKIQLAREKVRKESGESGLTDAQLDEYLIDELGIDLDDMSAADQIKLARFTKSEIDERKLEQAKFRQPIQNKQEGVNKGGEEMLKLDNGSTISRTDYDNLVNNRQKAIDSAKEAVNSVTASSFEVTFDDNGTERKEAYGYDFDDKDKHSMLSIVSDVNAYVDSSYRTDKGFNDKQFAEDMFFANPKNREKAIASIVHKAVAKNTEAILKMRGNVNYDPTKPLHKNNNDGGNIRTFDTIFNG